MTPPAYHQALVFRVTLEKNYFAVSKPWKTRRVWQLSKIQQSLVTHDSSFTLPFDPFSHCIFLASAQVIPYEPQRWPHFSSPSRLHSFPLNFNNDTDDMVHIDPADLPVPATHTAASLTADFARGWRKLPDELKCEILAHNLVFETPIGRHYLLQDARGSWSKDAARCDRVLHHHMCLGPEIAGLARQVYYERNTLALMGAYEISQSGNLTLPPHEVRKFVRRIILTSICMFFFWTNKAALKFLARNHFGFAGLKHLTIHLTRYDPAQLPFLCFPTSPLRFKCAGQIKLIDEFTEAEEEALRKMFVFGG